MTDKKLSELTDLGTLNAADTGDLVYVVASGNSRQAKVGGLKAAAASVTVSTDNAIARYNGTGGALQNSSATISDAGVLAVVNATDSASVQVARFDGDRATMADGDEAYASFLLSDDGGTQSEFARFTWVAVDVNAGTSIDGRIDFAVATAGVLADELSLDGTALFPATNDGLALGKAVTGEFSDIFLAEGAAINFDNGDVALTQTGNDLVLT